LLPLVLVGFIETVQTGCAKVASLAESIHLHEKNIAGPTERSRKGGEPPLRKLGGQDLRFSMKMMLTPDQEVSRSPSELLCFIESSSEAAKFLVDKINSLL